MATLGRVQFYGIDPSDNTLVARLNCGHLVGYPYEGVHEAAEMGAGIALRCPAGCVTEMIPPEYVESILMEFKWLEE